MAEKKTEKDYDASPDITIDVEFEDGTQKECDVLVRYPVGEQVYIALAPVDDETMDNIYLYRFAEKDGEPVLTNIESDEEYEMAADRFDEILDEIEYEQAEEG